jgi:hypothetical protein
MAAVDGGGSDCERSRYKGTEVALLRRGLGLHAAAPGRQLLKR